MNPDHSYNLAPYAVSSNNTRGREHRESKHPYRSDFARDRDRIIHSSAFRRLEGKTQVFKPGSDDNFRTRLTHSIEVAQIGRTIADVLSLNDTLTEAICLAHDLGHSPFGHCGESTLNSIMADQGGFEHNRQTVRVIELLENPYPDFKGLNLLYETRLSLSRHQSTYDDPQGDEFSENNPPLEGQIANLADRIAYNCHDLEDGLRCRMLNRDELGKLEIIEWASKILDLKGITGNFIRNTRLVKLILDSLISDAIESSKENIKLTSPQSLDDITSAHKPLITLSSPMDKRLRELEGFLLNKMYHNSSLKIANKKAEESLRRLFELYLANPEKMPGYYQKFVSDHGLKRAVCDYISGMTDRYCLQLLKKSLS